MRERKQAGQLYTINKVSRKISSLMSLDKLLPYITDCLQNTFEYYTASIFLIDHNSGGLILKAIASSEEEPKQTNLPWKMTTGIAYWVAHAGKPILANDVTKEPRYLYVESMPEAKSELATPIKLGTEMLGVLDVQSTELGAFDQLDLFTVKTLAAQIAIAIGNARLYQDSRELAMLEERNRLAREIHDTLAQGFTGILLQLVVAEQIMDRDINEARVHINYAKRLARGSLNEARRSVWSLRSQAPNQLPFTMAIRRAVSEFTQSTHVRATCRICGVRQALPSDTEDSLLHICQEALTNANKHAQASVVKVNLSYDVDAVSLSVKDNGIGFNPKKTAHEGFGLISIQERARLLSGILEVRSKLNQGTVLKVRIPTNRE